jgi:hypothetical protein
MTKPGDAEIKEVLALSPGFAMVRLFCEVWLVLSAADPY